MDRLEGLADEPRPGAAQKITDEQVDAVIVKTSEEARRTMTRTGRRGRWPVRWGLNQTEVSRIWRAFGLKPHLVDTWKLSQNPPFIEKVRDVVGCIWDHRTKPWCWRSTSWVGLKRVDAIAGVTFLQPALRTRRARLRAPGSPRVRVVGLSGCSWCCSCPGCRDVVRPVAIAADRHLLRLEQRHPVLGWPRTG
jgi:hypothetical protein